jgi:hypothetical protein
MWKPISVPRTMKHYLLWIPILILSTNIYADTIVSPGDVSGTWTKENSPYNIMGDITVQENQLLTIEPGVEVIFHGHYQLRLNNANLMAIGSPEDSILFTAADTNGFVNGEWDEGGWSGIHFSFGSTTDDSSQFAYCRFEFAKISGEEPEDQGVIGVVSLPKLLVRDCIFENNRTNEEGLIFIRWSDLVIHHNIFTRNVCRKIISMTEDSPEIYWNRFDSNDCEVVLWITDWNNPRIHHNLFKYNTGSHVIKTEGNCRPRIYQNWIINNTGHIISFANSKAEFINNLVANNDGPILELDEDESVFIQNTFVNNNAAPGHFMGLDKTSNLILGNIFNGNGSFILYTLGEKEPVIRYNMFDFDTTTWEGDTYSGIFENNSENDSPHFCINTGGVGRAFDAEFADFNIAPLANVVNQGDPDFPEEYITPDLYDRYRVRYGRIDFGAYEANIDLDTIPQSILRDTVITADTIHVMESFIIPDNVKLKISARAVVIFHGPDSIVVEGSLEAIGTADEPIRFTIDDTTGFAGSEIGSSGWRGIILDNRDGSMDDNDPSIFEHCIFEYTKGTPGRGGVFTLRDVDNFILNHSEFRYNYAPYNGHAIYAVESDFDMEYCSFHHHIEWGEDKFTYGTVHLRESSNTVDHCAFYNNKIYEGGGIYAYNCDLELSNSHFYNNDVPHRGFACALSSWGSDVHIYNCLVNNNDTDNDGVLTFKSSQVVMDNSTIVNNIVGDETPASGIGLRRTEMTIRNCIISGNVTGEGNESIMLWEDSSDPDLYNTLIEGGVDGIQTYTGFTYSGELVDCIDKKPWFISPSPNSGLVDTSLQLDWRLLDVSPAINTGTPDTAGMNLPLYDLGGIPRIMNDRIDMGAYEKSGKPPVIDIQPVGGNFCADDSIVLAIAYSQSDTVFLQWQKDGSDIPGGQSKDLVLYPAALEQTGNYSCRVSNSFGYVHSLPVFVNISAPPEILQQPEDAWVEPDRSLTLQVLLKGSQPMDIDWKLDDSDLGIHLSEYKFTPTDSSFEGNYTCTVSNICGTVETTPAHILLAPQICMVTVSATTGHNLVVWEKKTKAPIIWYNIYRESSASGIYDLLATQSSDDLSVYVDSLANPTVQAYLYKITAIDTAELETDIDLCKLHKTVHLLVSTTPESTSRQLEWDNYYGFDYQTYIIYRSIDASAFSEAESLSASLNSWTDTDLFPGDLYYRIAVEKPDPCTPEGGDEKASAGPYHHSLSNLDDNRLRAGQYPPDTITLSNNSIQEGNLPGVMVGKLFTEDEDSIDSHSYQFVPGEGDDDNISFTLLGDLLLTSETFDFETKNQYLIRIRSTDLFGNYCEVPLVIQIIDIDETTGLPIVNADPVKAYPNPFSRSTTIRFPNPSGSIYRMVLTDLSGKVCRIENDITGSKYVLKKGNLKEGFYFIELQGHKVYRGKIIVD